MRPSSAPTPGRTKSRPAVNITCPVSFILKALRAPTLPHPFRSIPAQSIGPYCAVCLSARRALHARLADLTARPSSAVACAAPPLNFSLASSLGAI
eukprot:758833-Pleurochrysis_carterae.AAC.1